jgi:hypothetical protein
VADVCYIYALVSPIDGFVYDEDVDEHGYVPFWQFRSIQDLRLVDRLRP